MKESDIVTFHVPGSVETKQLLSTPEFQQTKYGAVMTPGTEICRSEDGDRLYATLQEKGKKHNHENEH